MSQNSDLDPLDELASTRAGQTQTYLCQTDKHEYVEITVNEEGKLVTRLVCAHCGTTK